MSRLIVALLTDGQCVQTGKQKGEKMQLAFGCKHELGHRQVMFVSCDLQLVYSLDYFSF